MPLSIQPYLKLIRADKPIGTWLLLWPSLWSISIAAPTGGLPDLGLLATFSIGAIVMRGAGCTINDLWDRDIDNQVDRTKNRPLTSGQISVAQAIGFLGGQLGIGLGVLLSLNWYSIALGASSLALVGTYPLMKRFTYYPQAFLGLTFNWGALLGYSAVMATIEPSIVFPLYAAGISWTLVYDSIYAHMDKIDDQRVGVKSTALAWADNSKLYLSAFSALTIGGLAISGYNAGLSPIPLASGLALASSHLAWQISTVNLDSRGDCLSKFNSNRDFGAIVWATIVLSKLMA